MTAEKIGNYRFELLVCSHDDPLIEAGTYYVSIRDAVGTPLCSTSLTHRFESEKQARIFCQDVAKGKYSIQQLMKEERAAFEVWNRNQNHIARQSFDTFMTEVRALNISCDQLKGLFDAYDRLPADSRRMIRDQALLARYEQEFPAPNNSSQTLQDWLERAKQNAEVCLVDKNGTEHYLDTIFYASPDLLEKSFAYTDQEQWLLTLAIDHTANNPDRLYTQIYVKTDFGTDQVKFLLNRGEDGIYDPEMDNRFRRAVFAGADFNARLSFLTDGTSFETLFDPTCMDAVNPQDRKALCHAYASNPQLFILPATNENLYFVYALQTGKDGKIASYDLPFLACKTSTGKGLAFTLEGKLNLAQNRADVLRSGSNHSVHPGKKRL